MTVYTVKPSQAAASIVRAMSKGHVPFLKSSPGLGKSSIVQKIAKEYKLKVIDLRLSQCAPEDLMGLPIRDGDKATFASFDMFPVVGDKVPDDYNGWLLFLDEFNSGTKMVQAAAYKLVLDRMVGQANLHKRVAIVCAGNLETDGAIVTRLGTASQSRVIHYQLGMDWDEYLELFLELDFDFRIQAFLEWKKDMIHNFNPDHTEFTFPCPRTWEFASDMIKGIPTEELFLPDIAGCVGDGAATEFHTFTSEYGNLPKYSEIIQDPVRTHVPNQSSAKFALLSVLLNGDIENDVKPIITYLNKYEEEFQLIYIRSVIKKYPGMKNDKDLVAKRLELSRFTNGTGNSNAVAA
jgi:hypothetical protein